MIDVYHVKLNQYKNNTQRLQEQFEITNKISKEKINKLEKACKNYEYELCENKYNMKTIKEKLIEKENEIIKGNENIRSIQDKKEQLQTKIESETCTKDDLIVTLKEKENILQEKQKTMDSLQKKLEQNEHVIEMTHKENSKFEMENEILKNKIIFMEKNQEALYEVNSKNEIIIKNNIDHIDSLENKNKLYLKNDIELKETKEKLRLLKEEHQDVIQDFNSCAREILYKKDLFDQYLQEMKKNKENYFIHFDTINQKLHDKENFIILLEDHVGSINQLENYLQVIENCNSKCKEIDLTEIPHQLTLIKDREEEVQVLLSTATNEYQQFYDTLTSNFLYIIQYRVYVIYILFAFETAFLTFLYSKII
jgi:hypothetical protein